MQSFLKSRILYDSNLASHWGNKIDKSQDSGRRSITVNVTSEADKRNKDRQQKC